MGFSSWISQLGRAARSFCWGLFVFDWYKVLRSNQAKYNDAMNLVIFGEFLGMPLMNSAVSLRLLPYLVPYLKEWKRRQLTEREVLESAPHIH